MSQVEKLTVAVRTCLASLAARDIHVARETSAEVELGVN